MENSFASPLKIKPKQAYIEYLIKRANTPSHRVPPPTKSREPSRISQRNFEFVQPSRPNTPPTNAKSLNNSQEKTQKALSVNFLESTIENLSGKINSQVDNLFQAQLLEEESEVEHYHRVEPPIKRTRLSKIVTVLGKFVFSRSVCLFFFKSTILVLSVAFFIAVFLLFWKDEQAMTIKKRVIELK